MKIFSNLMTWRLIEAPRIPPDVIEAEMGAYAARAPRALELERTGWYPPIDPEAGRFVEPISTVDGYLVAMNVAKRLLPGKVVRREVERRARLLADEEGRKVFAREKQRIKEQVIDELLPAAFVDHSLVYAMIMPPYIMIGTSSAKTGEKLLDLLRHTLGSLKVVPVSVKTTPIRTYTRWFGDGGTGDERFTLGEEFTVHGSDSDSETLKGSLPFSGDETLSDWVASGARRVTSLGLSWRSETLDAMVPFQVNEMLGIKRIRWPESLREQTQDQMGEDEDGLAFLRASVSILAPELRALLSDLLDTLGGEALGALPDAWPGEAHGTDDDEELI